MDEPTDVVSHYGDEPSMVGIVVEAKAMQGEAGASFVRAILAYIRSGIAQALPGAPQLRSVHRRA